MTAMPVVFPDQGSSQMLPLASKEALPPQTRYCRNGTAETDFSATQEDPGQPAKIVCSTPGCKISFPAQAWECRFGIEVRPPEYTVLAVALQ